MDTGPNFFRKREKKTTLNNVQIVYCHERHHWITVTTVNCKPGEVKAFDSLFTYYDKETIGTIHNLFSTTNSPKPKITVDCCQKQKGETVCGLFAIAFATVNPGIYNLVNNQSAMGMHLIPFLIKSKCL